jgi:transposase
MRSSEGKASPFGPLSDIVRGEVMGLRQDRTEQTASTRLTTDLRPPQRGAITAICTDMHRPYLNAVAAVLSKAEIIFDKFHVLQHASGTLDEVRRLRISSGGCGDARPWTRETLAAASALEDRARVETSGTAEIVCGESAIVQSRIIEI